MKGVITIFPFVNKKEKKHKNCAFRASKTWALTFFMLQLTAGLLYNDWHEWYKHILEPCFEKIF